MIFLILFLALSVNASEVDINYRWYKYNDSSYMSISDSESISDAYIDYSDYIFDSFYDVKEYDELKGRYIYIYNRNGSRVDIDNISISYKGERRGYRFSLQFGGDSPMWLSSQGRIMLDLRGSLYLKDVIISIDYSGGSLEISYSNSGAFYDSKMAVMNIDCSGNYGFYNVNTGKSILFKTYYNRVNGEYRKEGYDDFIYKDVNDYKLYYFFYRDSIISRDMSIIDLLDTNYTFRGYEGVIDYDKNGKYNVHLIFDECEKDIVVNVSIPYDNDELNNVIKKKDNLIDDLNNKLKDNDSLIKELNERVNNSIKDKDVLNNNLNKCLNDNNDLNNKLKDNDSLIKELNERINDSIKDKDVLNNDLNKCINYNNDLNNKLKEKNKEIRNNKIIYEKNKNNYNDIVNLKNKCFLELDNIINLVNNKNKEIVYLKYKRDVDEDYYKRYIKKLKFIIDENNEELWNIKNKSNFVGFKILK